MISTIGMTREQIEKLLESALRFKSGDDESQRWRESLWRSCFFNPSLRTRASIAGWDLRAGRNAVVLEPGGTSWTLEHRVGA
jgi:aspartate carbamoyltransferase catalytic subunit